MAWSVERTVDEDQWTREYIHDVLASRPTYVPPKQLRLGDTTATWFEGEPGVAIIRTAGGSPDDRVLAEAYLREWLRSCGRTQAVFTFYRLSKVANWDDIMAKAARLLRSGNVTLLRNGAQNIIGHVVGDHGEYTTEISREDPNSATITQWQCECPWDQFAWQRTRQWKKYEGRPCAHVLATYWASQRAPLDEEASPGGQMNLFDPGTAQPAPQQAPVPGAGPSLAPVPQLSIPGVAVPGQQPQPPAPDVLPPYPGSPLVEPVVSVPGNNPGGPQNPLQWPGGTFSSWHFGVTEFENSDMVRLNADEYGIMEGKSEEHGAGQHKLIPKGSIGEVLGQDPTTGWVDVAFAGPQAQAGPMEPYHVRAWIEPGNLTPMPGVKKPGPFIKRR